MWCRTAQSLVASFRNRWLSPAPFSQPLVINAFTASRTIYVRLRPVVAAMREDISFPALHQLSRGVNDLIANQIHLALASTGAVIGEVYLSQSVLRQTELGLSDDSDDYSDCGVFGPGNKPTMCMVCRLISPSAGVLDNDGLGSDYCGVTEEGEFCDFDISDLEDLEGLESSLSTRYAVKGRYLYIPLAGEELGMVGVVRFAQQKQQQRRPPVEESWSVDKKAVDLALKAARSIYTALSLDLMRSQELMDYRRSLVVSRLPRRYFPLSRLFNPVIPGLEGSG